MIKIDTVEANKIVVKANKTKINRNTAFLYARWTRSAHDSVLKGLPAAMRMVP